MNKCKHVKKNFFNYKFYINLTKYKSKNLEKILNRNKSKIWNNACVIKEDLILKNTDKNNKINCPK